MEWWLSKVLTYSSMGLFANSAVLHTLHIKTECPGLFLGWLHLRKVFKLWHLVKRWEQQQQQQQQKNYNLVQMS